MKFPIIQLHSHNYEAYLRKVVLSFSTLIIKIIMTGRVQLYCKYNGRMELEHLHRVGRWEVPSQIQRLECRWSYC